MARYMFESGATREQLGQIAIVSRANAALNPDAAYRTPMSLDDYMGARMISDPLCLYDCDVPIDGAIAFVVSRADSAAIARDRVINIEAFGSAAGLEASSEMMWSRTKLTPGDVGLAELYDGFSILAVQWMEALGLCPKLGGGKFIEGGERISLNGELPLNTGGGQLSGGRMHGYGHLYHACRQLRGDCEERQVANDPDVAVISSGAAAFSSAMLISRS
jgi:acetyl-CoA acetyltransferase